MKAKEIKKIIKLIEYLDGEGIIFTNEDLVREALERYEYEE